MGYVINRFMGDPALLEPGIETLSQKMNLPCFGIIPHYSQMGIPEEDRERVFEPYYRAHRSVGLTEAVGLGLTVSRRLARAMEGDLTYQRYQGHSFFELRLPGV